MADYVPFYFAPRSPMMFAIHMGNVSAYQGGIQDLVYLVTSLERLIDLGLSPVLTDRNAALSYARFLDFRNQELPSNFVDWPLMRARYWKNTPDDYQRRERRQAECLVKGEVPWQAFTGVVVKNDYLRRHVAKTLQQAGVSVSVSVKPSWYFER